MTTLKLDNSPATIDLFADRYNIYIYGGRGVKLNSFCVDLKNKSTGETVQVFEHNLKLRDFNGVRCFYFDILKTGSYDISFHNFQTLEVKRSILPITSLFLPKIDLADIRIKIEKKHH
ncbi:MAG: hypothetical protein V4635_13650 [Bacteroidota bacterium]